VENILLAIGNLANEDGITIIDGIAIARAGISIAIATAIVIDAKPFSSPPVAD